MQFTSIHKCIQSSKASIFAVLLFVAATTRGFAQFIPGTLSMPQVQNVGIPKADMDTAFARQSKSEWCWAASIQMALNVYNVKVSQAKVVARTYGTGWDGDPVNQPGSDDAITRNLSGWSVDDGGQKYTVGCVAGNGAPNPVGLLNVLSQKHPVILALMMPSGSGHAVVCTAASYINGPNGPIIQTLIIRDPYPCNTPGASPDGRYEIAGAAIAQRIRGFWVVTAAVDDQDAADSKAKNLAEKMEKSSDGSTPNAESKTPDDTSMADKISGLEAKRDSLRALAEKADKQADGYDDKSAAADTQSATDRYDRMAAAARKRSENYNKRADDIDSQIDDLNANK